MILRAPLLCLGLAGCAAAAPDPATSAAGGPAVSPPAIELTHSGPVEVAAAPGQELHLARYVIPPHTALRRHYHEGTQIGLVVSGTLTYTVLTGRVGVFGRGADGQPQQVGEIVAGETTTVEAGHWLIEHADTTHVGANRADEPLVIVTSSLLRSGAPLATLVPD